MKTNKIPQQLSDLKPGSGVSLDSRDAFRADKAGVVYVVDDEYFSRAAVRGALADSGWEVAEFKDCESFLDAYRQRAQACLVLDLHLPAMTGRQLLDAIQALTPSLPTIIMSGSSRISEAVQSMKAGAFDFIEKPVDAACLVETVARALEQSRVSNSAESTRSIAADNIASLTTRQQQVMDLVLAGHPSKNIAADLGISQRTVEHHRAAVMHKTESASLPALARLALAALSGRRELRVPA